MKRFLLACLLAVLPGLGYAQQLANCATATPCTTSGPSATGTGDQPWYALGKVNANFLTLGALFSSPAGTIFGVTGGTGPVVALSTLPFTLTVPSGGTGATTLTGPIKGNGTSPLGPAAAADICALWTGTCNSTFYLRGDGTLAVPAGAGNVSTTGSPANGNLTKFTGATTISNADLTGDVTTAGTVATTVAKINGNAVSWGGAPSNNLGTLEAVQNAQAGNYTLVLSDSGKSIYHTSASAHTYTIPANASVAYPVGTVITVVNQSGGGALTIAITTDTLYWSPLGTTGSRTLAAFGLATLYKLDATHWLISGTGLT